MVIVGYKIHSNDRVGCAGVGSGTICEGQGIESNVVNILNESNCTIEYVWIEIPCLNKSLANHLTMMVMVIVKCSERLERLQKQKTQ